MDEMKDRNDSGVPDTWLHGSSILWSPMARTDFRYSDSKMSSSRGICGIWAESLRTVLDVVLNTITDDGRSKSILRKLYEGLHASVCLIRQENKESFAVHKPSRSQSFVMKALIHTGPRRSRALHHIEDWFYSSNATKQVTPWFMSDHGKQHKKSGHSL
jgi:hypothetical protein